MSLYRYFTVNKSLPDPSGPLSRIVPSSSIEAANAKVSPLLTEPQNPEEVVGRGPYQKLSAPKRAEIGRRAAEHAWVASTVRYYAGKLPEELKESSVRTWKKLYIAELEKKKRNCKSGDDLTVKELVDKKRGCPYLLGEKLEMQTRDYLQTLRANGAVVNTSIAIGCAEGLVMNEDSNLLASNGGHIVLTKHWGKHLLGRMGFVKRRASTKAKVTVEDFEALRHSFLLM